MRKLDIGNEKGRIVDIIKSYFLDTGFSKGIIGLSGEVDSRVIAYLTVQALGVKKM